MGLLTRLRSHERSKSYDPKPSADATQGLHSASSSGGSDFSFVSVSSQSSADKPKSLDPISKDAVFQRHSGSNRLSPQNRHSLAVVPSSPLRQTYSAGRSSHFQNHSMQNLGSANSLQNIVSANPMPYPATPGQATMQNPNSMQYPGNPGQTTQHPNSIQHPTNSIQHPTNSLPHPTNSLPHSAQSPIHSPRTDKNYAFNGRGPNDPQKPAESTSSVRPPKRMLSQRVASGLSHSSFEVSSADISGVSGNSGSSSECDDENDTLQESHPYYKQWKEYYEALERQKLDPTAVVAQQVAQSQAQLNISPTFLNQAKTRNSDNLVLNSRKSTIKSNRSASVPPFGHASATPQSRAVSANASSTAEPVTVSSSGTDLSLDMRSSVPESNSSGNISVKKSPVKSGEFYSRNVSPTRESEPIKDGQILHSKNTLSNTSSRDISPKRDVSQISDYAAYILYDDSIKEESGQNTSETLLKNDVSRQNSTASASSYNSLQSEKNFSVGRHPSRIAMPSSTGNSVKRKSSFSPPIIGPPPPIYPNMYNGAHQSTTSFTDFSRQSMVGMPMNNAYMQQMQQQIIQQMSQMSHLNNGQYQAPFTNGPQIAVSSDARINARIQEFIALRQAIASGNKSLEFRLQWLKMLVCAVNYKLFSYINIRGEPISQEQVSPNKQFFIKSVQTHLQKLLRELNNDRLKNKDKVFGEICYIQGCLYSQSYLERYFQDFGYEKDDEEAKRFFTLAIEYDPLCFKAFYELGELYESQDMEDTFDLALENYKESAQLGYNRAIYKVALIYLIVPKVRSTKYFKYFKNLADIDMESHEIQLSGIDLEELEQVVGLAQFQLGKIYEGIYPGDLTIEDQFVVESLELAPVNYAKSLSYYNRAAKLSCLQAQVKLGHVYEQGELNRPCNAVKSIQWYIKAATSPLKFKRHAEAMLGISRWFMQGTDGESKHIPFKDVQMGVQWCERACKEFGSAEALYQMGLYVEEGLVMGDAKSYFQEAAEMGHMLAMQKYEELQSWDSDAKRSIE